MTKASSDLCFYGHVEVNLWIPVGALSFQPAAIHTSPEQKVGECESGRESVCESECVPQEETQMVDFKASETAAAEF